MSSAPGPAAAPTVTQPPRTTTRPENLSSSSKRTNRTSLYSAQLPLVPSPPSIFSPFLSPLSPPDIKAIYDPVTKVVTVEGEDDMRLLWRSGFFGKGTLSRSEPSWMRRVENRRAEALGGVKKLTAEEITAQRRIERKSTKLVKKLEREADKLAAASAASVAGSTLTSPLPSALSLPLEVESELPEEEEFLTPIVEEADAEASPPSAPSPEWQLGAERTQLVAEEAFFLYFSLRCLSLTSYSPWIANDSQSRLSPLETWKCFLLAATSPVPTTSLSDIDPRLSRWDSTFLVSYAVYHHYRSMGWVIRSGSKFCVDWVLYGPGGPVGGHAEFAVLVLPSYADPQDKATNPFSQGKKGAEGEERDSWKWFNTVNRVCSGVKKTLVLLYVLIPSLSELPSETWIQENPAAALAKFEMREVVVRRWMAGRMRD